VKHGRKDLRIRSSSYWTDSCKFIVALAADEASNGTRFSHGFLTMLLKRALLAVTGEEAGDLDALNYRGTALANPSGAELLIDQVVFRENTEGMYGGVEFYPLPQSVYDALCLNPKMKPWKEKGLENVAISTREGFPPTPDAVRLAQRRLTDPTGQWSASMMRDMEAGRPVEADHIIGYMLNKARTYGVTAELLSMAYTHLKTYERRRLDGRLP